MEKIDILKTLKIVPNTLLNKFCSVENLEAIGKAVEIDTGRSVSFQLDEQFQAVVAITCRRFQLLEFNPENLNRLNQFALKELKFAIEPDDRIRDFWNKYQQEIPHVSLQAYNHGRPDEVHGPDYRKQVRHNIRTSKVPLSLRSNAVAAHFFGAEQPKLEHVDQLWTKIGFSQDGLTQRPRISDSTQMEYTPPQFRHIPFRSASERISRSLQNSSTLSSSALNPPKKSTNIWQEAERSNHAVYSSRIRVIT